jgi:hypothetical protein
MNDVLAEPHLTRRESEREMTRGWMVEMVCKCVKKKVLIERPCRGSEWWRPAIFCLARGCDVKHVSKTSSSSRLRGYMRSKVLLQVAGSERFL